MPSWTSARTLESSRDVQTSLALALPALLLLWFPPGGLLTPAAVHAGLTVRVSVASTGVPGNRHSDAPSVSADGRFVAFLSAATNLVPGDTNRQWDVFVHDRDTDEDGLFDEPGAITTRRVNVTSTGAQGNELSIEPSVSADGRFVAFASFATNLVPGDTNGQWDIFVHDRDTDEDGLFDEPGAITTRRVSVTSTGAQGNRYSFGPSVSADGRFVAFFSAATNLVPGDTNNVDDIFVHDRDADEDGVFDEPGASTTHRVSVRSTGVQGNGASEDPSVSADGRFVAFRSAATNLVPGDTNDQSDIFVHDRDADEDGVFDEPGASTTHRVSVRSTGVQGNSSSDSPSLSADGRFVAFRSAATNLVPGDTNDQSDIFVHDRLGIVEAVCAGFAATLLGTPGPDHLVGDAGTDVIHGLEGNDVLEGGAGDDLLCGGDDPDTLLGGAGNDRLVGGAGNDRLLGGTGHDKLFGRGGADQLFGGDGIDWLVGDEGADRLFGEADTDRLVGGPGADLLDGGDGQDRCEGGEDTAGDSAVACETVVDIP